MNSDLERMAKPKPPKQKIRNADVFFCPEELKQRSNLLPVYSILEELASQPHDIYIDSSILSLQDGRHSWNIFKNYRRAVSLSKRKNYKEAIKINSENLKNLVDFFEKFLTRDNVYVISEVVSEIKNYIHSVRKQANHLVSSADFAPIPKLEKILEENSKKLLELGIEEDPIIERVYSLLPSEIKFEDGYIRKPSHADKMLIAKSLSAGLTDGKNKIIISNDADIGLSVRKLWERLKANPRELYLEDIGDNFKKFYLDVLSLEKNEDETFLRPRATFNSAAFLHLYYSKAV